MKHQVVVTHIYIVQSAPNFTCLIRVPAWRHLHANIQSYSWTSQWEEVNRYAQNRPKSVREAENQLKVTEHAEVSERVFDCSCFQKTGMNILRKVNIHISSMCQLVELTLRFWAFLNDQSTIRWNLVKSITRGQSECVYSEEAEFRERRWESTYAHRTCWSEWGGVWVPVFAQDM